MPSPVELERERIERAGSLHWFHWAIVAMSLVLTVGAWYFARAQVEGRVRRQFERESQQVVGLVRERMEKYEDALWAGVALLNTRRGDVAHDEWRRYSDTIDIEEKYPGINGIGVIHAIAPGDETPYLVEQRRTRPGFEIHPPHGESAKYPITFIEPVAGNEQAVGLDMAHESNRLRATERARDSGEAQITGPIVLVQDAERTPGFLFFAPFYSGPPGDSTFEGMVYAPFVAHRLMRGVLDKETRHVGVRLSDNGETLYDELVADDSDFDPDPLYTSSVALDLYGRQWTFDIWSSKSFRSAQSTSQPLMILVGGIVIDSMLAGLFIMISRANRRTIGFADRVTRELHRKNAELEQFAYTASHDLKTPIFTIQGFAANVQRDALAGRTDRSAGFAGEIVRAADRMRESVDDLLELGRLGQTEAMPERVELGSIAAEVADGLGARVAANGACVEIDPELPLVYADPGRVRQALVNLIENAIVHGRSPGGVPEVTVGARRVGDRVELYVRDRGPGIDRQYQTQVFQPFRRLDADTDGSGVGLAIVSRIAESCGGRAWVESAPGQGACFFVSFPACDGDGVRAAA